MNKFGSSYKQLWFVITGLIFSALLFFLILEGVARVLISNPTFLDRIKGNDSSSLRLQWVRRHHAQASLDFDFDIHHPQRGWALKPDLKNKQAFGNKILNSNSKGIRGRKEHSYEKAQGKIRILTIGDSFTFGEEVSDNETFQSYLERLDSRLEVINLGVHGYGHDQMLLYLKEEGLKYKPDIVLLGFLYYDMERNLVSFRDFAKPYFKLRNNTLHLEGVPVPRPNEVLSQEVWRSKAFDLWTIVFERWRWQSGRNEQRAKDLSFSLLNEIVKISKETNAKTVFTYFVNESDFVNFFDEESEREKTFFDFCNQNEDVLCHSTRPLFLKQLKQGINVDTYGHWDRRGQMIAALTIYEFLERKKLLEKEAQSN